MSEPRDLILRALDPTESKRHVRERRWGETADAVIDALVENGYRIRRARAALGDTPPRPRLVDSDGTVWDARPAADVAVEPHEHDCEACSATGNGQEGQSEHTCTICGGTWYTNPAAVEPPQPETAP